jgi:hypothetical protein
MTVTEFMTVVTGLSKEELSDRTSNIIPIRADLNGWLTEKATCYVNRLPLYVDRSEFQDKTELLWQFLTTNHEQTTPAQQALSDSFLSQYERATDGLALIKHCIESHQDNMDQIQLNALFYTNRQGTSLFSLLIANPLFAEWLFDYHLVVTQNGQNEPSIAFAERHSPMNFLKTALMSSDKTARAIESTITQPGTLFFWLYYFQQDEPRVELFTAILSFIMRSAKRLLTYDALAPVLFDMLRSTKISVEHIILVQTFLQARFSEQVKGRDEHCWLTISLLLAQQESILATLRTNPWALSTLRNPEQMSIIRCLMKGRDADLREIEALIQREQQTSIRFSLFNTPLNETDGDDDFQYAKRSRLE